MKKIGNEIGIPLCILTQQNHDIITYILFRFRKTITSMHNKITIMLCCLMKHSEIMILLCCEKK